MAWKIRVEDFPINGKIYEQIKFLLGFGILAPSGHNGQPWEFKIVNNILNIFVNKKRALVKSDPSGKQLCIGIGCLIENFCIAANFYGFETVIQYGNYIISDDPIAKITLNKIKNISHDRDNLIHFITKRSTHRNNYTSQPIPEYFINNLHELSSDNIKIFIIQEKKLKEQIADLIIQAQITAMDKPYFRQELSELMKSNITKSKIGMPGFAFGLPLPISLFSWWMIKKINMSKLNKKIDEQTFKRFTSAFIIISSKDDTKISWINTGRLCEKIWLLAERHGLKCSPNAAPIQELGYKEQLQKLINSNLNPLVLMRVGYSKKISRSTPRLSVEDLIIKTP